MINGDINILVYIFLGLHVFIPSQCISRDETAESEGGCMVGFIRNLLFLQSGCSIMLIIDEPSSWLTATQTHDVDSLLVSGIGWVCNMV